MIRSAEPGDIPALLDIWNPIIRDTLVTFSAEQKTETGLASLIAGRTAEGFAFLVAEAPDRRLAGFATYAQFRNGNGYRRTMEHTVILAPWARGKGLGRDLMTAIEQHAARGGAHTIYAGVSAANPQGRAFHAALGYAEAAVLPQAGWKFGRWIDLVLMRKILDEGI